MNQNMNPFLEELYNLEPELREQEEYIMKIIAQMNVLKPRPYISENFRKVLKNRLISEELLQKNQKIPPKKRRYKGL